MIVTLKELLEIAKAENKAIGGRREPVAYYHPDR